ncbi:MAG: hypothetical protein IIU24_06835, partial [Selenomonas sp.]|nr:hypothetical protein [Selenomonas sp.]
VYMDEVDNTTLSGVVGPSACTVVYTGTLDATGSTMEIVFDTPYTYEDLRAAGVMVGSGGILVIDKRTSVLDFLRMNQEFFSEESCGQCTPCREGNLHIKIILDKMAAGTATPEDIKTMATIARVMSMSSLCGLGETAQNSLQSAMLKFPEVFDLGGAHA